ncbi:MAG: hypothetical protein KGO96_00770 [Elusimicrobia bacterium]|nr:hypothetical protein [Elusimicrobiota bacterium]
MVGPYLGTARGRAALAASSIELSGNLGHGGGWAEFSDSPEGVTVYAAGSAGFTPGALRRGAN